VRAVQGIWLMHSESLGVAESETNPDAIESFVVSVRLIQLLQS